MRKKDDALRETLLSLVRTVADEEGIEAINIRSLAKKAGVATGTVYNYFKDKDEILLVLTEEYWREMLSEMRASITAESFSSQIEEIFFFMKAHIDRSAGKLMGSLGNVEADGRERMASMQVELGAALMKRMEQDTKIRSDIWNSCFTKEEFAQFIMMNLTILLKTRATDIQFFIELVKRTIY